MEKRKNVENVKKKWEIATTKNLNDQPESFWSSAIQTTSSFGAEEKEKKKFFNLLKEVKINKNQGTYTNRAHEKSHTWTSHPGTHIRGSSRKDKICPKRLPIAWWGRSLGRPSIPEIEKAKLKSTINHIGQRHA